MSQQPNRSALVSGAGAAGGIGLAIAKSLVEEGVKVYITSTTDRIYDRAKEIGATGFIADLTDFTQSKKLISNI